MRPLQWHVLRQYRAWFHPLCHRITIPACLHASLRWWSNPVNLWQGIPFPPSQPNMTLTTDASKQGWGAHILHHRRSGFWTRTQARFRSNILELWAVHLSLRQCDGGGLHQQARGAKGVSLCKEVIKLLRWCRRRGITLVASHLSGQDNALADALSRRHRLPAQRGVRRWSGD